MKRLLPIPALVVGCLLWACDGNSPTEPEVVVDQAELMNFVNTPQWPDMNGNGYYCREDMGDQLIATRCILFADRPSICHTNQTCRDDNLKPGQVPPVVKCILLTNRPPVCIGPCGSNFDLVRVADAPPTSCNGGPPQG